MAVAISSLQKALPRARANLNFAQHSANIVHYVTHLMHISSDFFIHARDCTDAASYWLRANHVGRTAKPQPRCCSGTGGGRSAQTMPDRNHHNAKFSSHFHKIRCVGYTPGMVIHSADNNKISVSLHPICRHDIQSQAPETAIIGTTQTIDTKVTIDFLD